MFRLGTIRFLLFVATVIFAAVTSCFAVNRFPATSPLARSVVRAYDSSYPYALNLSQQLYDSAVSQHDTSSMFTALCIRSLIYSNTNRCSESISTLTGYRVGATYQPLQLATIGTCWFNAGNFDSAEYYHRAALKSVNPVAQPALFAFESFELAKSLIRTGKNEDALKYQQRGQQICIRLHDSAGIILGTELLARLYHAQRLYEKSAQYARTVIAYYNKHANIRGKALAALHLGNSLYMLFLDDSARFAYTHALNYYTQLGDSAGMAVCFSNLSRLSLEEGNNYRAIALAQKALSTIRPGNYVTVEAGTYQQLGDIYGELKQFPLAISYVQRALAAARSANNMIIVRDAYKSLSELYDAAALPTDALKALRAAYRIKDSIEPLMLTRQLAEMEARYEAEKKASEIERLRQSAQITELQVQQQHATILRQQFVFLLIAVVALALSVIIYLRMARRKLLEDAHRAKLIREAEEQERTRIAQDIHDELGSGLSRIRMLSALYHQNPDNAQGLPGTIASISSISEQLVANMRDLIWVMDPENTTWNSLIAAIREYSGEYLDNSRLQLIASFPNTIPPTHISKETYRHILMMVKEALQNIVKHANATSVTISVTFSNMFSLHIADNGVGFPLTKATSGNGLANLRTRSRNIGATLTFHSLPGKGTRLTLSVPLHARNTHTTKMV